MYPSLPCFSLISFFIPEGGESRDNNTRFNCIVFANFVYDFWELLYEYLDCQSETKELPSSEINF